LVKKHTWCELAFTRKLAALDLPVALFLLSALLGLWPAYDRSLCWNTLGVLIAGFWLYVLISRMAVSRRWWRIVAASTVVVSALLSLYFVTQYAHFGYPEKVGTITRLGALIDGIVPPAVVWTPVENSVATFLEGGLFLAVALVLAERRCPPVCGRRIVAAVGIGLIALALLMSAARGAWLAVLAASLLWLSLHWRPARMLLLGGAILGLGLATYVIVEGDIAALESVPVANRILVPLFLRPDRLDIYRNSVYLIQDFPLTGIGLGGQFAMVLSRYALLIQVPFLTYSHNLYLEIWLQHGLLGAVTWLWLMLALYQAAWTFRRQGKHGCCTTSTGRVHPPSQLEGTENEAGAYLRQAEGTGEGAYLPQVGRTECSVVRVAYFGSSPPQAGGTERGDLRPIAATSSPPQAGGTEGGRTDLLYQGTWLGLTATLLHGTVDARQYADPWCWFPFFILLGLTAAVTLRRASLVSQERRWLPLAGALAFLTIARIGLRPLPATWHANLGCVLQARGDLLESLNEEQQAVLRRRAIEQYRRAIRIAPHNRTAQQRMGLILMDEGHFQDAVSHLEKAWQADPDHTTTHKALGLAYVWVGELEKAKPLLQHVPDIVEELNVWGWWRGTQQQTQLAINAYRMSLMLEPGQPRLQEALDQLED